MTAKDLIKLVEKGECLNIEFKQRFSDYSKIAKEIIAFANTNGGYLIIGIDDDGSIYGVESEKGEAGLIKETAENHCEPPVFYKIEFVEIYGKEIVVVEIPESLTKPHRIQDYQNKFDLSTAQVYVRVNDKSVPASKEMIKILQTRASGTALTNYKIGKIEKTVFEFVEKNENINVKQLAETANISNRRASRTLINLVRAGLLIIHTKENGEEYFSSAGLSRE